MKWTFRSFASSKKIARSEEKCRLCALLRMHFFGQEHAFTLHAITWLMPSPPREKMHSASITERSRLFKWIHSRPDEKMHSNVIHRIDEFLAKLREKKCEVLDLVTALFSSPTPPPLSLPVSWALPPPSLGLARCSPDDKTICRPRSCLARGSLGVTSGRPRFPLFLLPLSTQYIRTPLEKVVLSRARAILRYSHNRKGIQGNTCE